MKSPIKVLVVDDEEMVRFVARAALERQGYCVLTASNGAEAVEMFRREPEAIALVILDLTMPVMGGDEAFHHLREVRPGVLVLLSSGYNESEAMRHFETLAVSGFLQKPYTISYLVEKVRTALGKPTVS